MLFSRLFARTLREDPKDAKAPAYALLVKGSYVRSLGNGLYTLLPLGLKVVHNVERTIREEMTNLGGQEILLPLVNPLELWRRSGRSVTAAEDLVRFTDRGGRHLVLAPTHEEAAAATVAELVRSYRDLPLFVFQFQTKFRDEERTRCGIVRAREFTMKDAYSFHRTFSDLNNFFPRVYHAYQRIFERCSVPAVAAEAASGYMGGDRSYEFLMDSECGDDEVIRCAGCGYTANREIAVGRRECYAGIPGILEEVPTPGCRSLDEVGRALRLPEHRLAKCLVYNTVDGPVMAVVRGDHDLSEEKLSIAGGREVLSLASEDELAARGLVPGYLSPLGLTDAMPVYVDSAVADTPNLAFGTNRNGSHYINVNFGRDFTVAGVADLARVREGSRCYHCGAKLHGVRAMELGHIFRLGDRYSRSLSLHFQEEDGSFVHPFMGSYGIGIGRLLAAVVEANRDRKGILWPEDLAPYRYFLMAIGKSPRVRLLAEKLNARLGDAVLFDDRRESISAKFKDADLLGIPYRLVVSSQSVDDGSVEVMERRTGSARRVPAESVPSFLEQAVPA